MVDAQLSALWRSCDQTLLAIEREISLLVRCCPTNAASEQQRLFEGWSAGTPVEPRWTYKPRASTDRAAETLLRIQTGLPSDPISALYAARAQELELERQLVTLVGSPALREHATRRFAFPEPAFVSAADALAEQWATLCAPTPSNPVLSDDTQSPLSLYSQMCALVGELRLPFRVTVSDALTAMAATGEGVIAVARGRLLGSERTRRIVVHEVYGHALPRERSLRLSLGLFQTGSAFGNDVQEGWALSMEIEHGVMDDERRRELGLRHLAAADVAAGADWVESMRALIARGTELGTALELAARAHRAGGLGRERVYLPAWCQVSAALNHDPDLGRWLGAGRVNVDAARTLRETATSWSQ